MDSVVFVFARRSMSECSKMVSKSTELCGPGEEIEITRFTLYSESESYLCVSSWREVFQSIAP